MASQGTAAKSRLTQMQMRFQQKQQQEREQKKTDIAGTRSLTNLDAGDTKNSLSSSLGPGKVRQMFDERRHRVVGIDKSYPLKPIPTKPTAPNATNDNNNNNLNSTTISSKRVPPQTKSGVGNVVGSINRQTTGSSIATKAITSTINSKPRVPPMMNRRKIETEKLASNGSAQPHGNRNSNRPHNGSNTNIADDDSLHSTKLLNVGKLPSKNLNNINILNNNLSEMLLNEPKNENGDLRLAMMDKTTTITTSPKVNSKSSSKLNSNNSTPKKQGLGTMSTGSLSTNNGISAVSVIPSGMKACTVCGRHFNEDRIAKHEEICKKTSSKKRKSFNSLQHRVMGTEAAKYVLKTNKSAAAKMKTKSTGISDLGKKSNWRKKHEEFIQAIRAAKEVKLHLARGGKLSDLPPPPASENPDYVQCPHCERRFNQTAAERHIPKCATMLHNKTKKPTMPAKKRI